MTPVAPQAKLGRVCLRRLAAHLVQCGGGLGAHDPWPGLDGQRLSPLEPLSALAELPVAIHEQCVVLPRPFGAVTVVTDQPFARAEQDKMVGVGMHVAAPRIIGEFLDCLVPDEGAALEHDERFVT